MRRNGWLLSMLGAAGLSWGQVQADDPFAPASPPKPASSGSTLYFPASKTGESAPPTRYQRSASTAPTDGQKNFYSDLFGEAVTPPPNRATPAPSPVSPSGPSNATPTPSGGIPFGPAAVSTSRQESSAANEVPPTQEVIRAQFERQTGSAQGTEILPVAGQAEGARPFPGARVLGSPEPGRSAPPAAGQRSELIFPLAPSESRTPSAPAVRAPAVQAPVIGPPRASSSSLTNPIPTTPTPSRSFAPSGPPVPSSSLTSTASSSIVPVSHSDRQRSESAATGPQVSLQWSSQGGINVGQECTCQLVVRNNGTQLAEDVEVDAYFPSNVRLLDATPRPEASENFLAWELDSLPAGSEQIILIKMVPLQRGSIDAEAHVRYSARSKNTFSVSEPLLNLALEGPTEVMIGEPASQKIIVSNPGSGIATNVKLLAAIPVGLKYANGDRIEMLIGSLNPGETRPVSLPLIAVAGGRHLIEVQARSDSGLVRAAGTEVAVIAPSLRTEITGPGLRYVGRNATYTVTVTNNGAAATDNVKVVYKIPQGLSFVSSDKGTQYDAANRLLSWFVGRLDLGGRSELNVTLKADQIGEFAHLVRATSEYGTQSDAQLSTTVEGTSSLSLHVTDLDDPVEVGSEAAYEIRVRNEGSAAARMVAVACDLPPGMMFQRSAGPTPHAPASAATNAVQFQPIAELPPGATATYTVFVSASRPGSLRFRARLSSESITDPLTSEELTKFYGE